MDIYFRDRREAGRRLGEKLRGMEAWRDPIVLALPRGGVPVGYEVARALGAPLDVFLVRKLGVPNHEELAMGAIASGGARIMNEDVVDALGIPSDAIERVAAQEEKELARREQLYRDGRVAPVLAGKTVILVDDGLATGATMRAAVAAVRREHARAIVVAVPVAARESVAVLRSEADAVVAVAIPEPFRAVGLWYDQFDQTSDSEVQALLHHAFDFPSVASG